MSDPLNTRRVRQVGASARLPGHAAARPAYDTEKAQRLIRKAFAANKAKNAAANEERKAREDLLALMQESGQVKIFTESEEGIPLEAEVETPQTRVVNVAKFKDLVEEAVFMQAVSVTQEAVKKYAGGIILAQCLQVVDGKTNVSVGVVK